MLLNTSRVASASSNVQKLVAELSKNKPDIAIIKKNTDSLGIPYNPDLIVLMSEVLVYLSKNAHVHKAQLGTLKEN